VSGRILDADCERSIVRTITGLPDPYQTRVYVRLLTAPYWGDPGLELSSRVAPLSRAEQRAVHVALYGLDYMYRIHLIYLAPSYGELSKPLEDTVSSFAIDNCRAYTFSEAEWYRETRFTHRPVINVHFDSAPDLAPSRVQLMHDMAGMLIRRYVHVDLTQATAVVL